MSGKILASLFTVLCICTISYSAQSASNATEGHAVHLIQLGAFKHHSVPGGIAIIATGIARSEPTPIVRWKNRPIATLATSEQWYALVGLPLSLSAGAQTLKVTSGTHTKTLNFTVDDNQYEEQRINITDKRKVNPAPLDMKRINKETARLKAVKNYRSEALLANDFSWPLEGPISSSFGLRRFFNDQPRKPHGGIDIAMPTGTPIVAPASGTVIDTGNYFFNGNSVFIDHGLGIQTFYAHMNTIAVNMGDAVKQGDVIGTVGETGRVTGAHLHWSLGVNGTWVNPMLVLP